MNNDEILAALEAQKQLELKIAVLEALVNKFTAETGIIGLQNDNDLLEAKIARLLKVLLSSNELAALPETTPMEVV